MDLSAIIIHSHVKRYLELLGEKNSIGLVVGQVRTILFNINFLVSIKGVFDKWILIFLKNNIMN